MYKFTYETRALRELEKINQNHKQQKRLKKILDDIAKNPYSLDFGGEPLHYDSKGLWSKRLGKKDRVVYFPIPQELTVIIISLLKHY